MNARRYREWYRKLLRFYPEPHRRRFGEGMEQTFSDLCCERKETRGDFPIFLLWVFIETSAGIIKENITSITMRSKPIIRIALLTLGLLLIPLLGNRFVEGWDWGPFDFVFAGTLLFGTGLMYQLVAGKSDLAVYRTAVGIALLAAFLLIWINLAVGIIGSEDNPANALYLGVLAVGLLGTVIVRLRPQKMAYVLFATALAQIAVPVIALIIWRPDFSPGVVAVFGLNMFFVILWTLSALLFRRAGEAANASSGKKPASGSYLSRKDT